MLVQLAGFDLAEVNGGNILAQPLEQLQALALIQKSDLPLLEVYENSYGNGWPHLPMPALRGRGFSASLGECSNGPMHEISDLLVSCATRWADERCMADKEGKAPDLEELDNCMAKLIDLFPVAGGGIPPRRCGYSMVVHAANRTGKELLKDNLGSMGCWPGPRSRRNLAAPADDIPFRAGSSATISCPGSLAQSFFFFFFFFFFSFAF